MSRNRSSVEMALAPEVAATHKPQKLTEAERREKLNEWFTNEYDKLKRSASFLRRTNASAGMSTGTLIHEAWLKLERSSWILPESELHFKRAAAQIMRQIVSSEARHHKAQKKGGDIIFVTLDDSVEAPIRTHAQLAFLDEALHKLASLAPRQAEVIEMRFYGGFTFAEIAEVLGVAEDTAGSDWRVAKAWLAVEIRKS